MPDLPRLLRHEPSPDRIALGPEVLALVVESLALLIHHNPERYRIHTRDDPAVEFRRSRVHCDRVTLARIAHLLRASVEQRPQHSALVVGSAADDEVLRHLAPALFEPGNVRLEATGGSDHRARPYPMRSAAPRHQRGGELAVVDLEVRDFCLVSDPCSEGLRRAVVRVDQRLATSEEKSIGSAQVKRSLERWLKAHTVSRHPLAEICGAADGESRERLVGLAGSDAPKVLPELVLEVGPGHDPIRARVHVAKVSRVPAVAAAEVPRGALQDEDARAALPCRDRGAQTGIASAEDQDVPGSRQVFCLAAFHRVPKPGATLDYQPEPSLSRRL